MYNICSKFDTFKKPLVTLSVDTSEKKNFQEVVKMEGLERALAPARVVSLSKIKLWVLPVMILPHKLKSGSLLMFGEIALLCSMVITFLT